MRERERGTLEQLVVTPIGKTSLMLGKTVPFAVVGYLQVTVILLLGRLMFGVPVRGSLLLLYLLIAPFIVASLGMGLFISSVTRTQTQAMQLSFFFIMPNILLSGFMFPQAAMPEPAQWVGAALPLTYFLTIMRGVLLEGRRAERRVAARADLDGVRSALRRDERAEVLEDRGVRQGQGPGTSGPWPLALGPFYLRQALSRETTMPTRKASATWEGGLKGGKGNFKAESGVSGALLVRVAVRERQTVEPRGAARGGAGLMLQHGAERRPREKRHAANAH